MAAIDFRLLLITDRRTCRNRQLKDVVEEAGKAGVRAVQLREKDLQAADLFALARNLQAICEKTETKLLINERTDIALALALAGVHLTSRSMPAMAVRRLLPDETLLGISTHSLQEAQQAEANGCDYVLFGPIFETPAKMRYGPPQGLQKLSLVTGKLKIPVFAVGGINPERAQRCLQDGAHGVAVISAIMAAPDVGRKIAEFRKFLGNRL